MTLTRLYIINFAGACFVAWAAWFGYVQFVFSHDVSHISYGIAAVFVLCVVRVFLGHTDHLEEAEKQLTGLGFIGTLVGFILALSGISGASMSTPDGLMSIGTGLLSGVGVAFCASLVGVICAQWLGLLGWLTRE
ncbi:hypothetical protein LB521_27640 [Mesorhizobium sp. BR-1-1-8]|uniref:hypothetical protein n=1 Tax=Mesorhizobium sp. BR-1-1-8 TaxID=2876659 RepID=UPI001CCC49F3|nr:hypothetical protein [Mesorhizobium sp. BR-1-1-8]MBZ9984910.1 hypothetical protein [Mesorhizobium sp. BR-1-1-8]